MRENIIRYSLAIITMSIILLVGGGCQETQEPQLIKNEEAESIVKKQLTFEEIQIVNRFKETIVLFSNILIEVEELPNLVEEATLLKYEGQHIVLTDELVKPDSELYKILGYSFESKLGSKLSPRNQRNISDLIEDNDVKIFWPYVQDNQDLSSITLTYNPLDNEIENKGLRFIKIDGKYAFQDTVLVNEDYAIQYPVWIFDEHNKLDEYDPYSRLYTVSKKKNSNNFSIGADEPLDDGNTFPTDPNQVNFQCCSQIRLNGTHQVNKIYLRHVRVMRNFRGLFGGENQIRIYTSPSNVSSLSVDALNAVSTFISRSDATNRRWKAVHRVIDQNWEINQIQKLFVFESVNTSNTTETNFTAGVKYGAKLKVDSKGLTLEIGPQFEVGVNVKIIRKNEFTRMTYNRSQFFFENWNNADSKGIYLNNAVRLHEFDRRNGQVFYTYGVVGYNF
jgi:hypothetical protein